MEDPHEQSVPDIEASPCNIGSGQRRRRVIIGVALLSVGILGSFWTKSFLWQVTAFFGFLSAFQSQTGICVFLAAGGAENQDDGRRPLSDPDQIEYFQKRSRGIYWRAFGATLVLMLIARASFILLDR